MLGLLLLFFFFFSCKGKIAGKIHKTELDAATNNQTNKQTDDDNQNSWNPNPKNKIPEWISFLLFFLATCSERKIDRIVKKNCKYQQGFLHPKKFFQQFLQRFFGFLLQNEGSLVLPSLCPHVLKTRWKGTSVRKCNWNYAGTKSGAGIRKGRAAPSGYHYGYKVR